MTNELSVFISFRPLRQPTLTRLCSFSVFLGCESCEKEAKGSAGVIRKAQEAYEVDVLCKYCQVVVVGRPFLHQVLPAVQDAIQAH